MNNKFQPKKEDRLQHLVNRFEESLEKAESAFFSEDDLEQLVDFYDNKKNIEKLLCVLDVANELFPFSSGFYLKKAQTLIQVKLFDDAWDCIEKALSFDPLSQEVLLVQVDLHVAEGELDNALAILRQLYELVSPAEKADVMLEFLDVYETFNHQEKVIATIQAIIQNYPGNEEIVHRLWSYADENNAYAEAIDLFKANVNAVPYNFLSWYFLASCYRNVGQLEKAIEAFEYTIAIQDYYFAYWDYALCLQNVGKFSKAISVYKEMLSLFEEELAVYIEMGHCYLAKKEFPQAIDAYNAVLENSTEKGNRAEAHFYIGKAFQKSGEEKLAIYQFKQATEWKNKKPKYWNALAKAYANNFELEEAANCYVKSLALLEEQPKVWRNLARIYYELDYKVAVEQTLQNAILVNPTSAKTFYHYAAYLFQFGKQENGLFLLEQALNLNSKKKNSIFALFPELKHNEQIIKLLEKFEK